MSSGESYDAQTIVDSIMVKLMDEFETRHFDELLDPLIELAGTKASIPLSGIGERRQRDVAEIARSTCILLLRERITSLSPSPVPISQNWLDPYFANQPVQFGEVEWAAHDRDIRKLAGYLEYGNLGPSRH